MGFRQNETCVSLVSIMCSSAMSHRPPPAQSVGQVKDGSGAVLANASVKLTLVANGTTRDTKTNDSGDFSAQLSTGEYTIPSRSRLC